MAALAEELHAAPMPVPAAYVASLAALSKDLRQIFDECQVPYYVQAAFQQDGCLQSWELAGRWRDSSDIRDNAHKELGFTDGLHHYDAKTQRLTSMRLERAATIAKARTDQIQAPLDSVPDAIVKLQPGLRATMEQEYLTRVKERPPLTDQGSDHYMGLQYKACQKGEIGYFTNKQIISYVPEPGERTTTRKRRRDTDGAIYEDDEETREDPYTMDQWKQQLKVFQTSLLMCCWVCPQHRNLDVTHDDMKKFYKYILGPDVAQSKPAPSVKVLMIAERKAWRKIAIFMHEGSDLKAAMEKVSSDALFWIREIDQQRSAAGTEKPKGKGKGKPSGKWGKGHGKAKGRKGQTKPYKGNYAGKGGKWGNAPAGAPQPATSQAAWPPGWATQDAKGVQVCRNHFLWKTCQGNCGRSHACPFVKANGQTCGQNHHPNDGKC
jgi:hypothetical protein